MVSQFTSVSIVCSTVCSGAAQRKHQSFAPLAFVRGIHQWPVDSPHKGPVTPKMFPFEDAIMFFIPYLLANWLIVIVAYSHINSLAPGRFQFNFRLAIFKLILVNGCWGISYEIALRWMPLDLTDDKSTLVQVMAWCRQATSHYLSQCWRRCVLPYGITRPQWVNQHGVEKLSNTMTSQWTRWRLKSPASPSFTQLFIRAQIKENIKTLCHWPLCVAFIGDRWIPSTNGQ